MFPSVDAPHSAGERLLILSGAATSWLCVASMYYSPRAQENAPAIILGIVFSALVYVLCLIALLEPLINNGSYVANEKAAAAILGLGISGCFVLVTPGWSDWEAPLLLLPSPYLGVLFEAKTSALVGVSSLLTVLYEGRALPAGNKQF